MPGHVPYTYTTLKALIDSPNGTKNLNIYGIIDSAPTISNGFTFVTLFDETSPVVIKIVGTIAGLAKGQVARIHRLTRQSQAERDAKAFGVIGRPLSIVSWAATANGETIGDPIVCSSREHTMTPEDTKRVSELFAYVTRVQQAQADELVKIFSPASPPRQSTTLQAQAVFSPNVLTAKTTRLAIVPTFDYSNLFVQVVDVCDQHDNFDASVLRVWDGGPATSVGKSQLRHIDRHIDLDYIIEADPAVEAASRNHTVDIFVYGFARQCRQNIKSGDWIKIVNVRLGSPKMHNYVYFALHEGGEGYNRGIYRYCGVDENEPVSVTPLPAGVIKLRDQVALQIAETREQLAKRAREAAAELASVDGTADVMGAPPSQHLPDPGPRLPFPVSPIGSLEALQVGNVVSVLRSKKGETVVRLWDGTKAAARRLPAPLSSHNTLDTERYIASAWPVLELAAFGNTIDIYSKNWAAHARGVPIKSSDFVCVHNALIINSMKRPGKPANTFAILPSSSVMGDITGEEGMKFGISKVEQFDFFIDPCPAYDGVVKRILAAVAAKKAELVADGRWSATWTRPRPLPGERARRTEDLDEEAERVRAREARELADVDQRINEEAERREEEGRGKEERRRGDEENRRGDDARPGFDPSAMDGGGGGTPGIRPVPRNRPGGNKEPSRSPAKVPAGGRRHEEEEIERVEEAAREVSEMDARFAEEERRRGEEEERRKVEEERRRVEDERRRVEDDRRREEEERRRAEDERRREEEERRRVEEEKRKVEEEKRREEEERRREEEKRKAEEKKREAEEKRRREEEERRREDNEDSTVPPRILRKRIGHNKAATSSPVKAPAGPRAKRPKVEVLSPETGSVREEGDRGDRPVKQSMSSPRPPKAPAQQTSGPRPVKESTSTVRTRQQARQERARTEEANVDRRTIKQSATTPRPAQGGGAMRPTTASPTTPRRPVVVQINSRGVQEIPPDREDSRESPPSKAATLMDCFEGKRVASVASREGRRRSGERHAALSVEADWMSRLRKDLEDAERGDGIEIDHEARAADDDVYMIAHRGGIKDALVEASYEFLTACLRCHTLQSAKQAASGPCCQRRKPDAHPRLYIYVPLMDPSEQSPAILLVFQADALFPDGVPDDLREERLEDLRQRKTGYAILKEKLKEMKTIVLLGATVVACGGIDNALLVNRGQIRPSG